MLYVEKFYKMNPEFEDLLPNGLHLEEGMIVLIEDPRVKSNPEHLHNEYWAARCDENNRWCEVSYITYEPCFTKDVHGNALAEMPPIVSFIATYPDGVKMKRSWSSTFAWIVKKDSFPGAAETKRIMDMDIHELLREIDDEKDDIPPDCEQ